MRRFSKLAKDLKQTRDEVRLRVHLGSKDIQDEWQKPERSWQTFEREAELDRSASARRRL